MKNRKNQKKLKLHRETLRSLNSMEILGHVVGGMEGEILGSNPQDIDCPSCKPISQCKCGCTI